MSKFYVILAALVITGLGGYFFKSALNTAKREGYAQCEADTKQRLLDGVKRGHEIKQKIKPPSDIDLALDNYGIMRSDNDR